MQNKKVYSTKQYGYLGMVYAFFVFALFSSSSCTKKKNDAQIPVLGKIPAFRFVDQDHQEFSNETLFGSYWVANFIFTSCPTFCPALTSQMKNLQNKLEEEEAVEFVSFSIDPEVDTPDRLKAYANKHGAKLENWSFVTGKVDEIKNTVIHGFKLAVGEKTPLPNGSYDITHAKYFVLVDPKGHIRGYYRSDLEHQQKIIEDIKYLVKNKGPSK